MLKNNQKGFTLIELIVVSAILGALMAIAIPQFNSYREKSERAAMLSECREIYRAFIVYYLANNEYPLAATADPKLFNLQTFAPLTTPSLMEDLPLTVDLANFKTKLAGTPPQAEKFDSPDDTLGINEEFYLILAWAKDPSVKFVISQADNISYADGTLVAGGAWLDGVFVTKNGTIIGL